jgi:branched-chain amino acid transport system permease protein
MIVMKSPALASQPLFTHFRVALILLAGFACVPVVSQVLGEPFYVRMFTRIMILALAALSLDLIIGYCGMVSFGHAAFMGIGAFVVGILSFHVSNPSEPAPAILSFLASRNALVSWSLAVLVSAFVALLIGLVALRTSGLYFLMVTLAFAQMLFFFFIALEKYGGQDGIQLEGPSTLPGIDLTNKFNFYYLVLAILAGIFFFLRRLVNSRFGLVIRGTKENVRRLQCLGYNTYPYRLSAFVLSGAIAGLAGALLACNEQFVSPSDMSWARSGELMAMIIIGGFGSLVGPIAGAVIYVMLEYSLGNLTTHWQMIFGPLLIAMVLAGRRGVIGLLCGRSTHG